MRAMVLIVVMWRGRIGLFKRTMDVSTERGLWHCVTGYMDAKGDPTWQSLQELFEKTGLTLSDLDSFIRGPVLKIRDDSGVEWAAHTFIVKSSRRKLVLNWEHDSYRWVYPSRLSRFDGKVACLSDVLEAFQMDWH